MALALFCGDALCKATIGLAPEQGLHWPVQCDACGSALYPADVLDRLPPSEFEPKRGELMTERGGRRVPVVAADLPASGAASADGGVDRLLAMVDVAPAPDERPAAAPSALHPVGSALRPGGPLRLDPAVMPPAPGLAAEQGVSCYRDRDTLVVATMGESHIAFPDRCVVCNAGVRRATFDFVQKTRFQMHFSLSRTTLWTPFFSVRESRGIDVDYSVCERHRLRRWLGLVWMLAAVAAFAMPIVALNLRLVSGSVGLGLMVVGFISALLLFFKGNRALAPMDLVEINATHARFKTGRPFLESFPPPQ